MLRDELLARFPLLAALPDDALVVGGAIRDLLLGRDPLDVDVTCDDPLACAERTGKPIRLGKDELSVWRMVRGDHIYDFAATTDLGRRDFTFNAMAVDLRSGELIDRFGGQADLRAGIVRMIAEKNFDDDPLRMLKAVRMAVKYGFAIDGATVAAIRPRAQAILEVAAERVTAELVAIFSCSAFRDALRWLRETALERPLFGSLGREVASDAITPAAAFALLLDEPRAFAERWRWSDQLLREVLGIQRLMSDRRGALRVAVFDAGASVAAQTVLALRAGGDAARAEEIERTATAELFAIEPLLTGDELAELGVARGPEMGRVKRALLEAQIRGEVRTREDARRFAAR